MWHESGYDSDGRWEESKTKYSMDVIFKEPGEYYFDVKTERNDGIGNNVKISAVEERGSNVPFLTLAILSAIVGGIAFYFGGAVSQEKTARAKRNRIVIVVLIILFIWALFYSIRGWGYMGYHGYHHGPSFWYMGGPNVYHGASNRDGSVSGAGNRGGGFSGGK